MSSKCNTEDDAMMQWALFRYGKCIERKHTQSREDVLRGIPQRDRRRAAGGRLHSDAQPMGVYFDRAAEPDAVKQRPRALTLACWPCRPRLPSPEASRAKHARQVASRACVGGGR